VCDRWGLCTAMRSSPYDQSECPTKQQKRYDVIWGHEGSLHPKSKERLETTRGEMRKVRIQGNLLCWLSRNIVYLCITRRKRTIWCNRIRGSLLFKRRPIENKKIRRPGNKIRFTMLNIYWLRSFQWHAHQERWDVLSFKEHSLFNRFAKYRRNRCPLFLRQTEGSPSDRLKKRERIVTNLLFQFNIRVCIDIIYDVFGCDIHLSYNDGTVWFYFLKEML